MKRQQQQFKVNLIGEQNLFKIGKEELDLIVAHFINGLKRHLELVGKILDK